MSNFREEWTVCPLRSPAAEQELVRGVNTAHATARSFFVLTMETISQVTDRRAGTGFQESVLAARLVLRK